MVTTGWSQAGDQTTSEIVDLTIKKDNMCKNWPKLPKDIHGATGGLVGNTVIICGGSYFYSYPYSISINECYSLTSQKVKLVTHMSVLRTSAASIVLNETILWVTGGWSGTESYSSTEYVSLSETMPGPDLPLSLFRHAMVSINSSVSMVIGGHNGGPTTTTFFYDHIDGEWINGPKLIQERGLHTAGIVTDEVTNENYVAVTGGEDTNSNELDTTEILQDEKWVQGKINHTISC